jgi:hypothetical protein
LRSNQAAIIVVLLIAFVSDTVPLVGLVAVLMLVGTALHTQAFRWVYRGILLPLHVLSPDPVPDYPVPHRFAQGLGGSFLAVAILTFVLSMPVVGWALTWLVIILAAVNLFLGFCAGCFVYYWLARWHVPGFTHSPPGGTFPGLRPPRA